MHRCRRCLITVRLVFAGLPVIVFAPALVAHTDWAKGLPFNFASTSRYALGVAAFVIPFGFVVFWRTLTRCYAVLARVRQGRRVSTWESRLFVPLGIACNTGSGLMLLSGLW